MTDPTCIANLLCIQVASPSRLARAARRQREPSVCARRQTCTDRPDESTCQIKCGDEFSNDVVGAFTKAAVSDTGCVPQRPDDNSWPVPPEEALVTKFSTEQLEGDW